MSVTKFEKMLPLLSLGKKDRAFFLKWVQRYGSGFFRRGKSPKSILGGVSQASYL